MDELTDLNLPANTQGRIYLHGVFAYSGPSPDSRYLTTAIDGAANYTPYAEAFLADGDGHGFGYYTAATGHSPTLHRTLAPLKADDILFNFAGHDGIVLGHAAVAVAHIEGHNHRSEQVQPVIAGNLPDGIAVVYEGDLTNLDDFWPSAPTRAQGWTRAYSVRRASGIPAGEAIEAMLAAADQTAWLLLVADGSRLYAHRKELPLYAFEHPTGVYLSSGRFGPASQLLPENTLHVW